MTAPSLTLWVAGTPAPQGSKRQLGRGILVESSKRVAPWREAVRAETARAAAGQVAFPDGPVAVDAKFLLPRPKSHYGSGRNAAVVKPSAPWWMASRPDLDKLARALLDGLTAGGAWRDDAQVASLHVEQLWTAGSAGVDVTARGLL